MRLTGRLVVSVGALGLVAAVVIGCWPIHRNGVSGSALRPHYSEYFGFVAAGPLPDNPTDNDLRRAGVLLPMDVVHDRRLRVLEVLAGAALLVVAGAAMSGAASRPGRS